jgi:hypothetical protein
MTDIDKDWCLNMAALEGDAEIGAGSLMHPWEEAKARIEEQAAEIERLRGKLREIEALPNYRCVAADMRKIARTALAGKAEQ